MYEILYLISTKIEEKKKPEIANKIQDLIKDSGGNVLNQIDLGERILAYPIEHEINGFYSVIYFETLTDKLKELHAKIKSLSEVLRFEILKSKGWEKKPEPPKEPKKKKKPEPIEEEKNPVDDLFTDDILDKIIKG